MPAALSHPDIIADAAPAPPALPRIATSLTVAALCTMLLWPARTIDMNEYLLPWMAHIHAQGQIGAFAAPFSNYTPPYLYLLALVAPLGDWVADFTVIKLVSVCGNLWLAFAAARMLRAAGYAAPGRAGALALMLPSVLLNAAWLGQCDALWTAPCLLAVAAAIERRPATMLIWCGIAIAFKAQAAFLAPFAIAVLLQERASWRLWLIPPLVYAAAMAPAWLAGWPAADLVTVYLRQAGHFEELSMNAPNLWMIVQHAGLADDPALASLGFAAAGIAALAIVAGFRKRMTVEGLLALALLSSLLLPGLLPRMHERFFFLAELLAFALALLRRDQASLLIFIAVEMGAFLSLWAFLSTHPGFAAAGAVGMIAATLALAQQFWTQPGKIVAATPTAANA